MASSRLVSTRTVVSASAGRAGVVAGLAAGFGAGGGGGAADAAAGLGAIFVPYPHAVDDHQTYNAKVLVQADAAISVPQGEFTAQHLADLLQKLDRPSCLQWAEQARKQALPDAAKLTAQAVISTFAAAQKD